MQGEVFFRENSVIVIQLIFISFMSQSQKKGIRLPIGLVLFYSFEDEIRVKMEEVKKYSIIENFQKFKHFSFRRKHSHSPSLGFFFMEQFFSK